MIFNPPYSICGVAGKTLDATWRTLADMGIHAASLSLRSIDVDTLTFTMRAKAGRIIPDDQQWISLKDNTGTVLITGIARRTYVYPQQLYTYTVVNVYQGLMDTPLTDSTHKAYLMYDMANLSTTLISLLQHSHDLGLPIQPPSTTPPLMVVPKMGFRSASCGSALEDALKWAPDFSSRMDYSTTPPTLRFTSRGSVTPTVINLDTPGHGVTTMTLTSMPEAQALFIAFVYAVRPGTLVVDYLIQSAGDPTADANRSVSIYLSGADRTEMLASEAINTSTNALATAQASLTAANAAVVAVNAQINATYQAAMEAIPVTASNYAFNTQSYVVANDSACTSGKANTNLLWGQGQPYFYGTQSPSAGGFATPAVGLYFVYASTPTVARSVAASCVVSPGTFTDAQLASVGVTKTAGLVKGTIAYRGVYTGVINVGGIYGGVQWWSGYANWTDTAHQAWWYFSVTGTSVDILSASAYSVAQALAAVAYNASHPVTTGTAATSFVSLAAFVEAPPDLALNYFIRQNWLPHQGQLTLSPNAGHIPEPGEFVSVSAADLPSEFATMATPVSELLIDLDTGSSTVTLGPPARMTFASLQDRLRIPPEDNYQPG